LFNVARLVNAAEIEAVPFVETRQAGSAKLSARVPMADLFHSFGNQRPGASPAIRSSTWAWSIFCARERAGRAPVQRIQTPVGLEPDTYVRRLDR
jgi:hypothetical protein